MMHGTRPNQRPKARKGRRFGRPRTRAGRLAAGLGVALVLSSCTIAIVSGPSTVTVGDTVTYVLEVGSDLGSDTNVSFYVIADIPEGWDLLSSTFDGTIASVPITGDATVVDSNFCNTVAGNVLPGLQRIHFAAGPFPVAHADDTANVSLTFDVASQPSGEFKIFFRFLGVGDAGGLCSTPAVRTINREGPGFLGFVQALFDGAGGVDGLDGARGAAAAPDGRHLYVASRTDDSVAAFARDPVTGELAFVQALFDGTGGIDGLDGAQAVAVTPDGRHVIVAASFGVANGLVVFSRDATTGELTFIEALADGAGGVDGLDGANEVAVTPDGRHVLVTAGHADHSIAVFARDQTSGELTFVEKLDDASDGVDGLNGANAVAVTLDGLYVYVASNRGGSSDDPVVVFSRDPATGSLSFVQALFNGTGGITGLGGASAVAVSPDQRHVIVAGWSADALTVFTRDQTTGELELVEARFNGSGGIFGLEEPLSVAFDAGGSRVFATGDNAVVVFARHPATGGLSFVEAQFQGDPPNQGLQGAAALAIVPGGPDGYYLYAASTGDDAVTAFRPSSLIFADGFESGDTARWQ